MDETRSTTVSQTGMHELHARVMELEVELDAIRAEHTAVVRLVDRLVAFLRVKHGSDSPSFQEVEAAAIDVTGHRGSAH